LKGILLQTGIWTHELRLAKKEHRHSTAWATPPIHFNLAILEMGGSQTICPKWPRIAILISASYLGFQA
jgi:hypothetical protein